MLHAIHWPIGFMPGMTDNFASNEVIAKGLNAAEVWPNLIDTSKWPLYYPNASDIHFYNGSSSILFAGARFRFVTFGLIVEAEVTEFVAPQDDKPARIAWHGWVEGDEAHFLDVHHAWLIEDLSENRVRVLTQECQNGQPAKEMAVAKPNPMINAHQNWLEGLIKYTREHLK